jgi:hypothetical protein
MRFTTGLLRRGVPYGGHIVDVRAANLRKAVEDTSQSDRVRLPRQLLEFIAHDIERGNVSSPAELFARMDAVLDGLSDDDIDLDAPLEGESDEE